VKIKELFPKQSKVNLEDCKILEISDVRTFQKFGKPGRVANAVIQDDSGKITLTLWNEQIDEVKEGDTVKITDGFVNEWQGLLQVTTGRNGKLEKM